MINEVIKEIVDSRSRNQQDMRAKFDLVAELREKALVISNAMTCPILEQNMANQGEAWNEAKHLVLDFMRLAEKVVGSKETPAGVIYRAKVRSERNYVNIGSVGAWRQGKSQFLQKLTTMSPWIIPVADGRSCTATSINIINDDYDGNKNVGLIYHYSLSEMCDIINSYLEKMGVTDRVKCNSDFVSQCASIASKEKQFRPSKDDSPLKESLMDYLNHAREYEGELNGRIEPIYEIGADTPNGRRFYSLISFRKEPDSSELSYRCLATKKAEVYRDIIIQGEPIERLRIMDTPGIGEERIGVDAAFREALREQLDIIFAIARIKEDVSALPVNENFQTKLKEELSGQDAANMLFYLFNLDDAVSLPTNKSAKSQYEALTQPLLRHLGTTTNEGIKGIDLANNHIVAINCKSDNKLVSFNSDGCAHLSNSSGAIQEFVYESLRETINLVQSIDQVHYASANNSYNEIRLLWDNLCRKLLSLNFPTISKIQDIEDVIKSLHNAFNAISESYIDITTGIKHDVNDFCALPIGDSIGKLFGISVDKNIDDEKLLHEFVTKNISIIKNRIKLLSYQGNNEFQDYAELKKELRTLMMNSIRSYIHDEEANRIIMSIKNGVLDALLETGKLGKICNSQEKKVLTVLDLLRQSNTAPVVYDRLLKFFAFPQKNIDQIQIDESNVDQYMCEPLKAADYLGSAIEEVLKQNSHEDDFGSKGFSSYERAIESFLYSLTIFEGNVKTDLSNETFGNAIQNLSTDFGKVLSDVLNLAPHKGAVDSGETRIELSKLYEKYYTEIFFDDNRAQLSVAVSSILDNVKN